MAWGQSDVYAFRGAQWLAALRGSDDPTAATPARAGPEAAAAATAATTTITGPVQAQAGKASKKQTYGQAGAGRRWKYISSLRTGKVK